MFEVQLFEVIFLKDLPAIIDFWIDFFAPLSAIIATEHVYRWEGSNKMKQKVDYT